MIHSSISSKPDFLLVLVVAVVVGLLATLTMQARAEGLLREVPSFSTFRGFSRDSEPRGPARLSGTDTVPQGAVRDSSGAVIH